MPPCLRDAARCPLCGQPNHCALAAAPSGEARSPCWCSGVRIAPEVLARIPLQQRGVACICPQCASATPALAASHGNPPRP